MESKTKHRILGLVVVAGIAILMYPFMLGNNPGASEKALVKAPPFPDQATQVLSVETPAENVIGMPEPAESVAVNAPADAPAAQPQDQQVDAAAEQASPNVVNISEQLQAPEVPDAPAASAADVKPATAAEVKPADQAAQIVSPIVDNQKVDGVVEDAKIKAVQKKIAPKTVKKLVDNTRVRAETVAIHSRITGRAARSAYKNSSIDKNGLMELKKAAYVIQLGSFKQKTNALKLVNKLRANGYRAFIQSVQASSGENTRVFVGPESRQVAARRVASQLAREMKLHGIVISYQPFTL